MCPSRALEDLEHLRHQINVSPRAETTLMRALPSHVHISPLPEFRIKHHSHPLRASASARDFHVFASLRTCHTSVARAWSTQFDLMLTCFFFVHKGSLLFQFRLQFITIMPIVHLATEGCGILQGCRYLHSSLPHHSSFDFGHSTTSKLLRECQVSLFFFVGSMRLHMLHISTPDDGVMTCSSISNGWSTPRGCNRATQCRMTRNTSESTRHPTAP